MTAFQELQMYKNFNELVNDVLDLAKEIFPDQLIYLSSFSNRQQVVLELSNKDTNIAISKGNVFNLNETLCNRIDFQKNQPLVYEDTEEANELSEYKDKLQKLHIRSYLGIPISLVNGEKFGTLCAVNDQVNQFDQRSIQLLQKIVRLFSYYLDLEHFAYRDMLSDLYNRRYLSQYFKDHSHNGGVIFFLDLDGFKKVNDVYGHDAGDLVLKEVASKLQKIVSKNSDAFAVRIGGDEFVVHFSSQLNEEEMSRQAELILESLSTWDAGYSLSTSIGIVKYPANCMFELEALLKQADQALYNAKTAGKNTYRFF